MILDIRNCFKVWLSTLNGNVINLILNQFRNVLFGIEIGIDHVGIAHIFDFDSDPDFDFEEIFQQSISLS